MRTTAAPRPHVLYVTYDGLLEPLGQSQVVSYVLRLAAQADLTVLSWEKPKDLADAAAIGGLSARLSAAGIDWIRLRYHKRPTLPATAWDILRGIMVGIRVTRARASTIVHARGYVSSVVALCVKRVTRTKFLFDMRGFWADEKVDGGHWCRRSLPYRLAKRWERAFFERADAIVSLTEAGVKGFPSLGYRMAPDAPIQVIPTCADLTQFAPGPRDPELVARFGLADRLVIGYVGTLSNWYLREDTLRYFATLVRTLPRARVLFVTREDHAALQRDARAAGLPADAMVTTAAEFRDMPAHVRLMDLGVFFIKPCFSKSGSAATKLAEFLGVGVPVVINDGIGDSGRIVRDHEVGVVLPATSAPAFEASLPDVRTLLADEGVKSRCVGTARRLFSLDEGVARYAALYAGLAATAGSH
ncbi:MAG TPA: glycosyltransferase [Methylomirabilota bacterium]|nr:glycosyltransferase [Methylomirabilota bacterium]